MFPGTRTLWTAAASLTLIASSCTITRSDPGFPDRRDAVLSVFEDDIRESERAFKELASPLSLTPATEATRGIHSKAQLVRDSIHRAKSALATYRTAQTEEEAQSKELLKRLEELRSQVTEFRRFAAVSIPVAG